MKRIALTAGEPAGIGPDLLVRVAQRNCPAQLIAVTDSALLLERAEQCRLPLKLSPFDPSHPSQAHQPGHLWVWDTPFPDTIYPGELQQKNVPTLLHTLDRAIEGCLSGFFHAMVTAPLHKGIINDAGIAFTGHTEYLAEKTNALHPVMMLADEGLRVVLATTHLPLSNVSDALNAADLEQTLRITVHALKEQFGIPHPHLLVCGLNPHAGEGGHLGTEEIELIQPVITQLQHEGFTLTGPLPADSLFAPAQRQQADAIVAMYHDQGLAPFKALSFGRAANITLGLPIIRTSVDHGTALSLAGTGKMDESSFFYALEQAIQLEHASETPRT